MATPDTTTQWHLRAPVPTNPIVFFGKRERVCVCEE